MVVDDLQIWVVSILQCEQHEVDPVPEDHVGAMPALVDSFKRFDNLIDESGTVRYSWCADRIISRLEKVKAAVEAIKQ
ncbi:hypothetical protein ACM16X_16160 [Haloarcula japonica]|uniref:hypothetical protein n=1 Tax=Haloarcula japonica TaxID=29282 RepID=UPI0039F6F416